MSKLRVLDLFSGIGGFSLGLERTGGFETVAFCEIETFPRRVLAKHWPKVPCYDDVRTLTAARLAADGISVDVICGGFPCQDVSFAGKGDGLEGKRSGLWSEFERLIGEVVPRYVIVENVAALLGRGLDRILGGLASIGYDAEWHCIPASALGFAHERDRLWIIAHADTNRLRASGAYEEETAPAEFLNSADIAAAFVAGRREIVADVGSYVHGFPELVDALRPLGNAVVLQIPELIGNAILRSMRSGPCTMGVGCDDYGICYADANGQPDRCKRLSQARAA